MINFLYCFDKNYILQAKTSINSLLQKSSEKINIHIISNENSNLSEIHSEFINNPNLENMYTYLFDSKNYNFPNIKGAHVSEATYYRIFIDEILEENVQFLIYLDADIICLNDPIKFIQHEITVLEKDGKTLSAITEGTRQDSPILFEKLKLLNDTYFNAGVIIIDFKKWKRLNVKENLIKVLNERSEDLIFWDQDILNIHFDGDFSNMNKLLNYNFTFFNPELNSEMKNNIIFLHYSGKNKPWNVENVHDSFSQPYQNAYRSIGKYHYHIVFRKNMKSINGFLKTLFSKNIFKLDYPISFIFISLRSFIKR